MSRTLVVKRRGYKRQPYSRKGGIRVRGAVVPGTTARIIDVGKPGLTPESQRFYYPKVKMNWHKGDAVTLRRQRALRAHKGDVLATGRALQSLANVTTDRQTATQARKDAKYFFGRLR
jgi:RecA-family ATPase